MEEKIKKLEKKNCSQRAKLEELHGELRSLTPLDLISMTGFGADETLEVIVFCM